MRAQELAGHIVALLILDKNTEGEPDWSVLYGTVEVESGTDGAVFIGTGQNGRISLTGEQLARAQPVSEQQRAALAPAEFFISMSIRPIPAGAEASDYQRTGFKLPE